MLKAVLAFISILPELIRLFRQYENAKQENNINSKVKEFKKGDNEQKLKAVSDILNN